MSAQIRQLTRPVDPEVVRYLEEALAEAKAGKLSGVLILQQDAEGLAYAVAGVKDRFALIGWLSHAIHKLQTDVGS